MRIMKESNIDTIGIIPSDWKLCKLKNYATIQNGKDYKKVYANDGKYPVIGSGGPFAQASKCLYNLPSVLLGRKGTIDKPLFINQPFWTIDTMYYTKISKDADPKYFYYLCTQIDFNRYRYGSAIPSMTQRNLNGILFPLPPKEIQIKISSYLDQKCTAISSIVEHQRLIIEKLEEYKKSIITKAVTKGLDLNMPMKDSGIEWIGQIPKHWHVLKMKYLGDFNSGGTDKKIIEGETCYKSIQYTDVYHGSLKSIGSSEKYLVVSASNEKSKKCKLEKGDLLFTNSSETPEDMGHSTLISEDLPDTLFGYHLMRFRPHNKIIPDYLIFLCGSTYVRSWFTYRSVGMTRFGIDGKSFSELKLPVPPKDEQNKIANNLKKICNNLENSINIKKQQIEKLEMYKKSLIFECVTGKKQVETEERT